MQSDRNEDKKMIEYAEKVFGEASVVGETLKDIVILACVAIKRAK